MPPVLGTLQHQSSSGAGKHRATLPSHSQPKIENSSLEHGARGSAEARRKPGDLSAMRGVQGKIIGRLWAPAGIYNNPAVFKLVTFGWLKMLVASVKNCALMRSFSVKSVRV